MERLTRVIKAHGKSVVVYTKGKYEDTTAGEMEHKDIRNVMTHLSDYEDTGLTPEKIVKLKERNTPKEAIYEIYGDQGCGDQPDAWICPNCEAVYDVNDDYDFCPDCGQMILR